MNCATRLFFVFVSHSLTLSLYLQTKRPPAGIRGRSHQTISRSVKLKGLSVDWRDGGGFVTKTRNGALRISAISEFLDAL